MGLEIAFSVLVWQQLSSSGTGLLFNDFRVFYGGATVAAHGGNPYRRAALTVAERLIPGYSSWGGKSDPFVSPPAVAVLFWPLIRLPLVAAYAVFTALGVGCLAAAILAFTRDLGWHKGVLLAVGTIASSIAAFGLVTGQLDTILLAASLGAVVLAWRRSYLGAGLVMGLFWLKPDILWPAALFCGLALWPDRRPALRYTVGLGVGTAVLAAIDLPLLPTWLASLPRFQQQKQLVGIPGVFLERIWPSTHASGTTFVALAAFGVLLLAALGTWILFAPRWSAMDQRTRILWSVGLSLAVWLSVTPYSHPDDFLLLLPLVVGMVGRDAARAGETAVAVALLVLAIPVGNFTSQLWPIGLNPAPLPATVALLAGLWTFWRRPPETSADSAGDTVARVGAPL